jgi:hypothetical protein
VSCLSLPRLRGRAAASNASGGWGRLYDDPTRLASLATLPFQGRDEKANAPLSRGGPDDVEYNPILSYVNGDISPASLAADSAPGIAYNGAIHSRVRPASQFE